MAHAIGSASTELHPCCVITPYVVKERMIARACSYHLSLPMCVFYQQVMTTQIRQTSQRLLTYFLVANQPIVKNPGQSSSVTYSQPNCMPWQNKS